VSALLAPENTPFAVALALLLLLVLVQLIGIAHLFPDIDGDLPDVDGGGHAVDIGGGLVSMLGIGRVPLIVWLSFFLASFGLLGLSMQELIAGIFGAPFPAPAASGMALIAAVPANAVITNLIGKVWPRDETTAVPIEALLGRRGTIALGKAERGNPARAIVSDLHGQMHNVMVEPHEEGASFTQGDEVLLVRREGELFYALDGQGPIRLS
jgi:hypothetical protein